MATFEEYKLIVEQTERLSARRAAATQFFFSIGTALLAAIAYVVTQPGSTVGEQAAVTLSLCACGLMLSVLWYRTISAYRKLTLWRLDQLMELEKQLKVFGLFSREYEFLFGDAPKPDDARFSFGAAGVELKIPWLFGAFYVLALLVLCVRFAR